MEKIEPTISVAMLAYKHEPFLAQAIESVMAQQTDFPVELVVGEDCSPDRTREVALAYERKHPGKVRLITSATNVGMHENARRVFNSCKGRYIAICEGDDYWNDALKLQKQVAFLESAGDCVMCFHPVHRLSLETSQPLDIWAPEERRGTWLLDDILAANFIPSPSVCFRNLSPGAFPEWIFDRQLPMVDWPLFVWAMEHGSAHWDAEPMSTYRVHTGGAWGGMSQKKQILAFIAFHSKMLTHVLKNHRRISRRALSHFYLSLSKESSPNRREELAHFLHSLAVLDPRDWRWELMPRMRRLGKILSGGSSLP